MLLNGIAAGLTFMPAASLVVGGVKPEHAGSASGLLQTSQQLGGAIGLAVVVSVYAAGAVPGAHAAFLTTVAFTLVAFIVTVLAVHPSRSKAAKTAYSSPVGGERDTLALAPAHQANSAIGSADDEVHTADRVGDDLLGVEGAHLAAHVAHGADDDMEVVSRRGVLRF
ncbi:hypothetical protein ACFWWB_29070 [Streptomyces sp. NPDC058690]|uniref:hypothetical protein n=1 Tax=Streptomyces sp. NPDC058690 TaxID=3346600 RepID=UPI00366559F6